MARPVEPETDPPVVGIDRALRLLRQGDVEVLGRIPWASNATLLARVCEDGLEGLAIYKPVRGERPLWDFPDGTLYRREVAAYVVSEALGWQLVPPTIAREDAPFGAGSMQLWVDADPGVTAFELLETGHPAMRLIALFDAVVNNADRKAGHCLLVRDTAGEERVWAIDHGVCFHVEPKLRTVIWEYGGDRIGARELADLGRFDAALGNGNVAQTLNALLDPDEMAALRARVRRLLGRERLPRPAGERAWPWPPV